MNTKPYTRTGDIIVAVNPYQWYNDLYTEEKRRLYSRRLVWDGSSAAKDTVRASLQPHVYEVSALAYRGLLDDSSNQSILVSGESGAGKTETVKICLNHIASIQYGQHSGYSEIDPIVSRVVESNPLLEAFGNAKTRRNDNSSRFGKYLQLQFQADPQTISGFVTKVPQKCTLVGSVCDVYLLERTRVIGHDVDERTFHIFYQLLAAPDDVKVKFWEGLRGKTNESFKYVGSTTTNAIDGVHDSDRFQETLKALIMVGIEGQQLQTLMQAICIILQLGNVSFQPSRCGDADKSVISSVDDLNKLSNLMCVSSTDLAASFTERTFRTGKECHKVPLNTEAAREACDALAKESYQKVFSWLVNTINKATRAMVLHDQSYGTIGLLDIFGFEIFPHNRFEQLCINFANEKLQQKFNEDIFKNVMAEYRSEGISLDEITFDDNTDVLDLIEGRTGLLNLLNEECIRPRGNDLDFVHKALRMNQCSPVLKVHKTDRLSFAIQHYAGLVMYDAEAFVYKNLDTLPTDLQECAKRCSNAIISMPCMELSTSRAAGRRVSNIVAPTVWTKYTDQLSALMCNLRKTKSRYIRCIKPNSTKTPLLMEHETTVEQLRCAGVVAGITIARSSFPNRLANSVVLARYLNLLDTTNYPSTKTSNMSVAEKQHCDCKALLESALKCEETRDGKGKIMKAFVVGKTKTFFRAGALEYLERGRRNGLDTTAITIQRIIRGWLARHEKQNKRRVQHLEEMSRQEAEAERQAQLMREAKERRDRNQSEMEKLRSLVDKLEKRCEEFARTQDRKVQEALDRIEQSRKELNAMKSAHSKDVEETTKRHHIVSIEQEKTIEENNKLIQYLKRENNRAQKENEKVRSKLEETKQKSSSIQEAHGLLEQGLENTKESLAAGTKVQADVNAAKLESKSLRKEVNKMHAIYMKEAKARLKLQKALAKIVTSVQDRVRNRTIVEESVVMALQAEAVGKSVMAALDVYSLEPDLTCSGVSESEGPDFWSW
jgi:myosin heavy subunit